MMKQCQVSVDDEWTAGKRILGTLAVLAAFSLIMLPDPIHALAAMACVYLPPTQQESFLPASSLAGLSYAGISSSAAITYHTYLPLLGKPAAPERCQAIAGESYSALSVISPRTDRPAESHPDLNLAIRGYAPTTGYLGLLDLDGSSDPSAPQLPGLFGDNRTPAITSVYQVYDWDWEHNIRGTLISKPPVTLAGFATSQGEIIHVPDSGYNIGTADVVPLLGVAVGAGGYEVLVLYASTDRITLKYTREDDVVRGYTLHIEDICVEPNLLALYEHWNELGRSSLPALSAGHGIGRARGDRVRVAIRDSGSFMEPRSRKDWWRGR
jgi:hypothetical protein